jgi:hypothetical protein
MLNHAAWCENKRSEERVRRTSGDGLDPEVNKDPQVFGGKKLSELSSAELTVYYGGFGAEDF